ncbi:MAG: signal peptide peptidase SppA [Chitinivibrionales bacterium]|nr:signal peptide peptidase SppA [Chitinivibrionales bacterium]
MESRAAGGSVNKQRKWLIVALCLLPVVAAVVVLAIQNAQGEESLFGARRIGLVRIEDVIVESEEYVRQLHTLAEDESVAGIVLRLNSPGGAVSASQEVYHEVLRVRDKGKPVVVSMGNVAASGAYYIACASDRIFASAGTLTGSIGVIMRLSHVYRLFDKVGIEVESIKTGEFKNTGTPFREMRPDEREYLQQLIDDTYEQFLEHVSAGREIPIDSLRPLAEGQVFTGRQALREGLIDTLGGLRDALLYAKATTGVGEDAKVIEPGRRVPPWLEPLMARIWLGRKLLDNVLYGGGIYYLYDAG